MYLQHKHEIRFLLQEVPDIVLGLANFTVSGHQYLTAKWSDQGVRVGAHVHLHIVE